MFGCFLLYSIASPTLRTLLVLCCITQDYMLYTTRVPLHTWIRTHMHMPQLTHDMRLRLVIVYACDATSDLMTQLVCNAVCILTVCMWQQQWSGVGHEMMPAFEFGVDQRQVRHAHAHTLCL